MAPSRTEIAYTFLQARNGKTFTPPELAEATGWAVSTARTYISKNWHPWVERVRPGLYRVDGFGLLSLDEFIQRQSQMKSDGYGDEEELRELLEAAIHGGEGSHYEFKEELPGQAHNLGKEIAAFATSGGGAIFLGISDAAAVIGLEGLEDEEARSDFRERVEGIARVVRPVVTPRIAYLDYGGATLCIVSVPDGGEPVYYYDHRPYVRIGSQSRPAEPEDVKQRISDWISGGGTGGAQGSRGRPRRHALTAAALRADRGFQLP